MQICAECGRQSGAGRSCTGCGHQVAPGAGGRTDTAERPAVQVPLAPSQSPPPPVRLPSTLPPPQAFQTPPPARYPLFADDVRRTAPHTDPVAPAPVAAALAAPAEPTEPGEGPRRRSGAWLPVSVSLLALTLVAMTGALLLTSGGDDPTTPVVSDDPPAGDVDPVPADQPPGQQRRAPREPEPREPARPVDVAAAATVRAPRTAPPQQDVRGATVSYDATNMVDGTARTTWRMPGDGTGQEILIQLAGPTRLTAVGLINGYAKRDGRFDWYAGNRRVRAVEWRFDDGTVVRQALRDDRGLQGISVDDVATRTVRLRLLDVSGPGEGPSRRDFTAISEIALLGVPG